jgi:hypothetical protein
MILVLTNSDDATADYLLHRLGEANLPYVRFNTDGTLAQTEFSYSPERPVLRIDQRSYSPADIRHVWYRRPEILKHESIPDTPEGKCVLDEWSEALEGFFAHIPSDRWINWPAANALSSRKIEQLTAASRLGFSVPDTLITQDEAAFRAFFEKCDGRVVVKPLGKASIERPDGQTDSIIYTNALSQSDLQDLAIVKACPTFLQRFVEKSADIRITAVDSAIHAVELTAKDNDGRQRCDIRRNNMQDVTYRAIHLPDKVDGMVRRLMSHYGLRFAAIDMVVDVDGRWHFLEVNPNGQWAWLDLCGVTTIYKSFIESFLGISR